MATLHSISLKTPNPPQNRVKAFTEAVQVMHDVRDVADRFRAEEGGHSDLDTSDLSVTLNKATLKSRTPKYSGVVTFQDADTSKKSPLGVVSVIAENQVQGRETETYYGYSRQGDLATYTRNTSEGEIQNHEVVHNLATDTITYTYH